MAPWDSAPTHIDPSLSNDELSLPRPATGGFRWVVSPYRKPDGLVEEFQSLANPRKCAD